MQTKTNPLLRIIIFTVIALSIYARADLIFRLLKIESYHRLYPVIASVVAGLILSAFAKMTLQGFALPFVILFRILAVFEYFISLIFSLTSNLFVLLSILIIYFVPYGVSAFFADKYFGEHGLLGISIAFIVLLMFTFGHVIRWIRRLFNKTISYTYEDTLMFKWSEAIWQTMTRIGDQSGGNPGSCILPPLKFVATIALVGFIGYLLIKAQSSSSNQRINPPSSTSSTIRYTTTGLNMRLQPSADSKIVLELRAGEEVTLTQQQKLVDGSTWVSIKARGKDGWVNSKFLRTQQ